MVKEMYQPKPITTYLLGRTADIISTYINVKKYSPEYEVNVIVRELFYRLGIETSLVGWFAFTALGYSFLFYAASKTLEKSAHKPGGTNVKIWKDIYNGLLYGFSAGCFYASVNNLLVYLNLPHISAEYGQIFGAAIVVVLTSYLYIYKKLRSRK